MKYQWLRRYRSCRDHELPVPQFKIQECPELVTEIPLATCVLPEHLLNIRAFEIHGMDRTSVKQHVCKKGFQMPAEPFIHWNGKAVLGLMKRAFGQCLFKGFFQQV